MDSSKTTGKLYYEALRLLSKDTLEAIHRLKKVCINKHTHYIFINDHIGDVVISLGYLEAYRKKIGANNITLVIAEKYKELINYYSADFDEVIFLTQYELYRLFLINATTFGMRYLINEYPNVTIINPADSTRLGFDYLRLFPDMNLVKMIRFGCYALSNTAIFNPLPKIQMTNSKSKRALLTLEARTVRQGTILLYKSIIPHLKTLGYEVYTNTGDGECLENTLPVYKKIHELRDFLGNGVLIGVRSGVHDLLLYQDCKVVAIYPENYDYGNLFSLKQMPDIVARYLELKQSGNSEIDCKKVMAFIRGEND